MPEHGWVGICCSADSELACLQVVDFLGSAAFSKAVQAIDLKTGGLVCLKIVKVHNITSFQPLAMAGRSCNVCCSTVASSVDGKCEPLQNNKDYFDQSLDEIKLLRYINDNDPADEHGVLRLYDYFYHKVRGSA